MSGIARSWSVVRLLAFNSYIVHVKKKTFYRTKCFQFSNVPKATPHISILPHKIFWRRWNFPTNRIFKDILIFSSAALLSMVLFPIWNSFPQIVVVSLLSGSLLASPYWFVWDTAISVPKLLPVPQAQRQKICRVRLFQINHGPTGRRGRSVTAERGALRRLEVRCVSCSSRRRNLRKATRKYLLSDTLLFRSFFFRLEARHNKHTPLFAFC